MGSKINVLIAYIKYTLEFSERDCFESNVLYKEYPFFSNGMHVCQRNLILWRIMIYSKTSIDIVLYIN